MNQNEHAWFIEQIAAYLAGGQDQPERERFQTHLAECGECAAELESMRQEDKTMQAAFAGSVPGAEFEQRIIAGLRQRWTPRLVIHPMVRRAAAGVAAVLVLGAIGYTTTTMLSEGGLPTIGSGGSSGDGVAVGPFRVSAWPFGRNRTVCANDLRIMGRTPDSDAIDKESQANGPVQSELAVYSDGKADEGDGDTWALGDRKITLKGATVSSGIKESRSVSTIQPPSAQLAYGLVRPDAPADPRSFKPAELAAGAILPLEKADHQLGRFVAGDVQEGLRVPTSGTDGKASGDGTLLLGGVALGDARKRESGVSMNGNAVATHYFFSTNGSASKDPAALGRIASGTEIAAANTKDLANTPAVGVRGSPDGNAPAQGQQPANATPAATTDSTAGRKIIRNGTMEFEVDSFDSAFAQVSKIVKEEGGFVASTESQKLPNGKMTGMVTLRVAPEHLDTLILKLRALGDLKNQKIAAQDITKQYTDLESQLRASRAMEQRLLEIIKTGKGEIKDLVAAEKELGVWREKIEQVEGEIRFYNSQISLSTLQIALSEKDVKGAAFTSETELRSVGIEAEDVEKAYASAQELVSEFKGHIVTAVLKKLEAGQFAASIVCDVSPENAGPMSDRLKQLGNVARLEAERKLTTSDGAEPPVTSKVQRKDTRFVISLYNLANIAPRETTNLNLACGNVEQAYRSILLRVAKSGGRVVGSNLNQLKADQTTATLSFQVKSDQADALLAELRKPANAGDAEVTRLTTTENPDTANVTIAKRGFAVQIVSLASVTPRETVNLQLAVPSVADAYKSLTELLNGQTIQARILSSRLSEQDRQNVTGSLDFEVRRADLPAIDKALTSAGDVFSRNASRATDAENTIDSKVRLTMGLINAQNLAPRETFSISLEAANVEKALGDISLAAAGLKGRSAESHLTRQANGQTTGRVTIDVPLVSSAEILKTIREQGTVRTVETGRNAQVPDGSLARARLEIVVSNGEGIVSGDKGIWASVRNALSTSVAGLLWSLQLIVIGLFLIVPWAVAIWGGTKLVRRMRSAKNRRSVVPVPGGKD